MLKVKTEVVTERKDSLRKMNCNCVYDRVLNLNNLFKRVLLIIKFLIILKKHIKSNVKCDL